MDQYGTFRSWPDEDSVLSEISVMPCMFIHYSIHALIMTSHYLYAAKNLIKPLLHGKRLASGKLESRESGCTTAQSTLLP